MNITARNIKVQIKEMWVNSSFSFVSNEYGFTISLIHILGDWGSPMVRWLMLITGSEIKKRQFGFLWEHVLWDHTVCHFYQKLQVSWPVSAKGERILSDKFLQVLWNINRKAEESLKLVSKKTLRQNTTAIQIVWEQLADHVTCSTSQMCWLDNKHIGSSLVTRCPISP